MRTSRVVCVVLAALMVIGSGSEGFAKMGKTSMGSRASRTYDRPIERSVTPPPMTAPPMAAPVRPAPMPMAPQSTGFFQSHPFMSGFMGGMVGAGIGSMLFGHPSYASYDDAPGAGLLGLLLQLALVGGLIWWMLRLFRGGRNPVAQLVAMPQAPQTVARVAKEFEPSDADKQIFGQILVEAQRAWTMGDIGALKQIATPEMVSYLADDLAADSSQGLRNVIEGVQLQRGDVIEAWSENNRQFATAVLTFAAKDYTVRLDTGSVVEGDPGKPVQNVEAWTFVRVPNGRWVLSAVERQNG